MRRNQFDKKFIEFPLVCLSYCSGDKNLLKDILIMCIVDNALKSTIKELCNPELIKANDFDCKNPIHQKIALVSIEYNTPLFSFEEAINKWIDIKTKIIEYEKIYGKDAYCRMGKQLIEDVINGRFGFREYAVLAAIHSILGKSKPYARITYEQISCRVLGYKKKSIKEVEIKNESALSARQIKTSILKLVKKKLVTTITYQQREKYYSTKIKKRDSLCELIAKKKLKHHELKLGIEDQIWSNNLRQQMDSMRYKSVVITRQLNRST
ncbi:MAG: hypothetical protein KF816_08415 [Melioribacteraceae bacterium]|nr:hypothetical protein [Melioribacteraceae bacterium]